MQHNPEFRSMYVIITRLLCPRCGSLGERQRQRLLAHAILQCQALRKKKAKMRMTSNSAAHIACLRIYSNIQRRQHEDMTVSVASSSARHTPATPVDMAHGQEIVGLYSL